MTVIHITEERLLELLDMKADDLFAALDEIKADPIQKNWVYDAEEEGKLAQAVEEAEKFQRAFAAQSRKLQAVLHIDGVRATLAELKGNGDE